MEPTTGIEPVDLILTKDALYQLSYVGMERETGFEPATHSLEGCCSSQLSYSRNIKLRFRVPGLPTFEPTTRTFNPFSMVERGGFEPPKASPTDLQSVPFGHSGTSPTAGYQLLAISFRRRKLTAKNRKLFGAGDGTRTRNRLITNQLLYRLSYASKLLQTDKF